MRFVITTVIVLIAAAAVAVFAMQDPGYIMLSFRDWTIETSFTLFAVAILLVFVVLYAAFRLLIAAGLLPRRMRRWRKVHGADVGRKQLEKGMMKLTLGQWHDAEKLFIKSARHQEVAPLAYLAAARAAQGQGVESRRDGYIQLAQQKAPKDSLALTVAQAQIQADFGQTDQAINTLRRLPGNEHKNPAVLKLLARLYTDTQDWPGLVALLPQLKQQKILPQYQFFETEHQAYSGMIKHIGRHKDAAALWELWRRIPKQLRVKEDIIADFAIAMVNFGQGDAAEEMLYQRLNKQWSDALIYVYGLLDGDAEVHLSRGRNWLKKHPDNPVLLLSLGRLALRSHQWEAAREYLEASLKITPNAETYQELGNLLAFLNEQPQALECYRRGLALTSDSFVQPELKTGMVQLGRPQAMVEQSPAEEAAGRLESAQPNPA
jgi:HemY protein